MQGTLIKYKDGGTEEPFNARMMFGIMKLRDAFVTNDEERLQFDNLYTPVFENLDEALGCKNQLVDLIANHKKKIESKEIVGFQHNGEILEINESIDRDMSKLFKEFFIKGEIAMKSLQRLCKTYGLEIGFFYQDDNAFKKGVSKFSTEKKTDTQAIIEMLTNDRKWHSTFNEIRIAIEHGGLSLGNIKYRHDSGGNVAIYVPRINNKEIHEVVTIMSSNISDFIEDIIAMTINRNLKNGFYVVQIPEDKRDPSLPLKYTVSIDGLRAY